MASKEDCDELDTIKAIIRSLLIADKRPLTLREFLSEFKSSEGQELPFRQYGFGDPLDFLRSLPDTVRLTQGSNANEFYVMPTVTKDVQHIQNLVKGQKAPKPLVKRPPTTIKHANSLKKVQHVHNLVNDQKTSKPLMPQQDISSKEGCDKLETIKAIIRSLLIADKRPLTLRQFLCEFKSSEGQELPFKQHGFGDPLEFLQSLPDTVRLTQGSNANEFYVRPTVTKDVQHIQNLVSGQKAPKPLVSRPPTTIKHANGLNKVKHVQNLVKGQKTSKPLVNRPPTTLKPANNLKKVQHVQNFGSGQTKSKPLASNPPTTSKPVESVSRPQPVPRAPAVLQQPPNSQPPCILKETKDNLRQLMADHYMSGIDVLQLDEVYTRRFGSNIDYETFGYNTIEDFVLSMPDIFCATRSSAEVMRVFANRIYCHQPPVEGTLAHFSLLSTPVKMTVPCFYVHRAQPVQKKS